MKRKEANYYKPYTDPATGKTKYRYVGEYYSLPLKGAEAKRTNLTLLGFALGQLAVFCVQGFLGNAGANAFYVLLPYVCTLLPITLTIWSAVQRCFHKGELFTAIAHRQCIRQMYSCALFSLVLSACAAIGDVFFVIRAASGLLETAFILLSALNAVLALAIIRIHRKYPAKTLKKSAETE